MHEINYPKVKTWFIASTGEHISIGMVDVGQCMSTGLDSLETFTIYQDYLNRCTELGIEAGE